MAFQWREFLIIAESLHTSGKGSQLPEEAAYRCVISRAYYAAFCHARDYAELHLGFVPKKKAIDHENLRKHLFRQGMGTISTKLDQLREWRNDSDYDNPSPTPTEGIAIQAMNDADRLIKKL
jgi:uncharacterized protein (UPF0332 family)